MSQTDAYLNAGYKTETREIAAVGAYDLLKKPYINSFLESHRSKQLAKVEDNLLSKSEKRQILANFARAQLIDLIDDNGKAKVDKNSSAAKALKEWYRREKTDKDGNPIVTSSLKMIDPLAAIMEDNKMTGDYAPTKSLIASRVQFEVRLIERNKVRDAIE